MAAPAAKKMTLLQRMLELCSPAGALAEPDAVDVVVVVVIVVVVCC